MNAKHFVVTYVYGVHKWFSCNTVYTWDRLLVHRQIDFIIFPGVKKWPIWMNAKHFFSHKCMEFTNDSHVIQMNCEDEPTVYTWDRLLVHKQIDFIIFSGVKKWPIRATAKLFFSPYVYGVHKWFSCNTHGTDWFHYLPWGSRMAYRNWMRNFFFSHKWYGASQMILI
mgnify:CR=1 FL=1